MTLTSHQRRFLKGLAHKLTPSVHLGKNGWSEALRKEVDRQLGDLELIKVRISVEERQEFLHLAQVIADASQSHLVQTIGRIAVLYREGEEPEIKLPGKTRLSP
jgi:RNA-binding protein